MKLNKIEMLYLITFTACFIGLLYGFAVGDLNMIEIINDINK